MVFGRPRPKRIPLAQVPPVAQDLPTVEPDLPPAGDDGDLCPGEDETWNGYRDDDGCPDELPTLDEGEIEAWIDLAVSSEVKTIPPPPLPSFESVRFDDNRYRLLVSGVDTVDAVAQFLVRHPDVLVLVTGHADPRGTAGHNFDLSLRRAREVEAQLRARGVQASQIVAHAMSDANAQGTQQGETRLAEDRRVEFLLLRP